MAFRRFSFVNTLDKYSANMFDFSVSSFVTLEFGYSGSVFSFPIPSCSVVLDRLYFQKRFFFFFILLGSLFSRLSNLFSCC